MVERGYRTPPGAAAGGGRRRRAAGLPPRQLFCLLTPSALRQHCAPFRAFAHTCTCLQCSKDKGITPTQTKKKKKKKDLNPVLPLLLHARAAPHAAAPHPLPRTALLRARDTFHCAANFSLRDKRRDSSKPHASNILRQTKQQEMRFQAGRLTHAALLPDALKLPVA